MTISHRFPPGNAPYVVPGPRATDAIGKALREVYREPPPIPDDLAALLAKIDCGGHA